MLVDFWEDGLKVGLISFPTVLLYISKSLGTQCPACFFIPTLKGKIILVPGPALAYYSGCLRMKLVSSATHSLHEYKQIQ